MRMASPPFPYQPAARQEVRSDARRHPIFDLRMRASQHLQQLACPQPGCERRNSHSSSVRTRRILCGQECGARLRFTSSRFPSSANRGILLGPIRLLTRYRVQSSVVVNRSLSASRMNCNRSSIRTVSNQGTAHLAIAGGAVQIRRNVLPMH